MGEVVDLKPTRLEDDELVENLARYADGTLSMSAVKSRHRLTDADWTALGADDELVRRIENRKLQRIRGGQTKKERAAIEVADAGPILGKIMRDPGSNARHVIDSVKTLDALATGGGEAAAAGTIFEISINLGDQTLHFSKPIATDVPAAIDTDPRNNTDTPDEWLPMIAASERKDDGGGQGHL